MTSDVCRNHLHHEIIRSFLEWSSQISRFTPSTLHLRKSLEDGSLSIQSMVDSTIKIDMKNVREPEPLSSQAVTLGVMRLSGVCSPR
jgi:hypothetical protein